MEYFCPKSLEEAYELKQKNKHFVFLAGGTIVNSRSYSKKDIKGLIDLKSLGLNKLSEGKIGSMLSLQDVSEEEQVHISLREASMHLANRNIRNIATIGGNIASNKSCSDIIITALALKAELEIFTDAGFERVALSDWLPRSSDIITSVVINGSNRQVFQKRYSRTANDISILKICIGYELSSGGVLQDVLVSAGCVSDKAVILKGLSSYLEGKDVRVLNKELLEIALSEVSPVDDLRASAEYRKDLVKAALIDFISSWK